MSFPRWLLPLCPLLPLLLAACASPARRQGMVDLRRSIPGISVDLRYATAQNVTRRPLYPPDMPCLLRASTAAKLKKAQTHLRAQGYGLRIWDAWRPMEVHQRLYDQGAHTGLFLHPRSGWSRHCGGVSVDVTLVDRQGREQPMPTYFDEDLFQASSTRPSPDPIRRQNRAILHQAMIAAGFQPLPAEWWHFDDLDFLYHPVPVIKAQDIGVKLLP